MKTFKQFSEAKNSFTLRGVPVKITPSKGGFITYVDGDKLDTYSTEKEAKTMAKQFIGHLKVNA